MRMAAVALALAVLAASARGEFIQINTTLEIKDERLEVTVRNEGSSPAKDVRVLVDFLGQDVLGRLEAELPAGGVYQEDFEFDPSRAELPGLHPAVATVSYADLENNRFSALVARPLPVGDAVRGDIHLEVSPLRLRGRTAVPVVVTNRSPRLKQVELELRVSPDIRVLESVRSFDLGPWGREQFSFTLENHSAREGSIYPVYAVAQYREGGRLYTWMAAAPVTVGSPAASPKLFLWPGLIAAILLALVLALAFRSRRRRRKSSARKRISS